MDKMLERAARALATAHWGLEAGQLECADMPNEAFYVEHNWKRHVAGASAVLQAIRTPSEGMKRAFTETALRTSISEVGGWHGYATEQWQVMIDAALSE